jgi:aspartyl-tRNA(Asn)/glutamyl-tRNA(Gln) amidotransferase subunit A
MDKIYANYDIIFTPTTPEVAWKIGKNDGDPLKMYLADIYTVTANMG